MVPTFKWLFLTKLWGPFSSVTSFKYTNTFNHFSWSKSLWYNCAFWDFDSSLLFILCEKHGELVRSAAEVLLRRRGSIVHGVLVQAHGAARETFARDSTGDDDHFSISSIQDRSRFDPFFRRVGENKTFFSWDIFEVITLSTCRRGTNHVDSARRHSSLAVL